jgi:tryptophanyl-tRNA synthetase
MGKEVFVLPEAHIRDEVMTIPGTDGRKMSKSYNNYIDIFLPEKQLRKAVMGIQTDSTPLEAPKNPDTCTVFALYSLLATPAEQAEMRTLYANADGTFGYGHAKQMLFDRLLAHFAEARARHTQLMANPAEIYRILAEGEAKAAAIATQVLARVRGALGLE